MRLLKNGSVYNEDMTNRRDPIKAYAQLGAKLRELRKKAGRSGPWVIREMERRDPDLAVKKSWLYAVETGDRRPPLGKLELLCSTIGAAVYLEIYEEDGEEQPAMLKPEHAALIRDLRELDEEGQRMVYRLARIWRQLSKLQKMTLESVVFAWEEAVRLSGTEEAEKVVKA